MDQVHQEVDRVMGDRAEPTVADYTDLKYTMRWLRSPPPPSSVPQAPLPQNRRMEVALSQTRAVPPA